MAQGRAMENGSPHQSEKQGNRRVETPPPPPPPSLLLSCQGRTCSGHFICFELLRAGKQIAPGTMVPVYVYEGSMVMCLALFGHHSLAMCPCNHVYTCTTLQVIHPPQSFAQREDRAGPAKMCSAGQDKQLYWARGEEKNTLAVQAGLCLLR